MVYSYRIHIHTNFVESYLKILVYLIYLQLKSKIIKLFSIIRFGHTTTYSDRTFLIESKHMESFEVQWRECNKSQHPLWNVVVSTPFRTHAIVSSTVDHTRCFFSRVFVIENRLYVYFFNKPVIIAPTKILC